MGTSLSSAALSGTAAQGRWGGRRGGVCERVFLVLVRPTALKLLGSSLHEAQLVTRERGANLAMVAFPCVPGKAFPDLMRLLDDLHLPSEWEHTTRAAFLDFWPCSFLPEENFTGNLMVQFPQVCLDLSSDPLMAPVKIFDACGHSLDDNASLRVSSALFMDFPWQSGDYGLLLSATQVCRQPIDSDVALCSATAFQMPIFSEGLSFRPGTQQMR